ncbi:hypothetical protein [Streptomyces sp. CC210A]|uniref:hypothetical protein n=1 Tax=Streptomyces sp. CC210A TaxID=2898184 RepID=UPI001F46C2D8|nr:hypothetical protein [Streptomyces sp. CC210A]
MDPADLSPPPAPTPSSGLLRLLLRVDAVTSAPRFLMVLCPLLLLLVLGVTGTTAGLAAAGALFAAWAAVGCVGMRYQRVSGSAPAAGGRRRRRPRG